MNLSKHFSLEELTASDTAIRLGIDNTPPEYALRNLGTLAQSMEEVRAMLGFPIHVNSGFRCLMLNRKLGSKDTSAHLAGLAVDFTCSGFGTPLDICNAIASSLIAFDQVIQEGTWCHFAIAHEGLIGRQDLLTAHFGPSGTTYSKGLEA